eukprot:scaffold40634_cov24-Phaeocystis_antarctica.AAC.1
MLAVHEARVFAGKQRPPRGVTPTRLISKQPTQGAASKKARRPALERSHLGICVRARAPVYSEGD